MLYMQQKSSLIPPITSGAAAFGGPATPAPPPPSRPANPLLSEPILPTLLRLAVPNVLSMTMAVLVGIAETYYIGLLGLPLVHKNSWTNFLAQPIFRNGSTKPNQADSVSASGD